MRTRLDKAGTTATARPVGGSATNARPKGRRAAVALGVVLSGLMAATGTAPAARVLRPVRIPPVRIVLSRGQSGTISPYLFGANLLWPYNAEGAFDARTDGFFPRFVAEARAMGVTALRYPAGITSDSFDWQRAIGPLGERRPNEPYGAQADIRSKVCCIIDEPVASNVGPDEFGRLLGELGSIGTVTVNFVTGNAKEAADFVSYMTAPYTGRRAQGPGQPGYWAALRAKNGHPAPYHVPYWEVGNEQDGPWQFGWRTGHLVSLGPHRRSCRDIEVCLYVFGGTTSFRRQPAGIFADSDRSASYSTGRPWQTFYVYFPPAVPKSQVVFVAGRAWWPVKTFARSGPRSDVYLFNPRSGKISFGNGRHGAVPEAGSEITVSYESGPHDGFVEFYTAMKRANPHIHVCEAEEQDVHFLQVMGRTYRYDCVELHKYARPLDIRAPIGRYEQDLMSYPLAEGRQVGNLQWQIRHYSGRNIPIVLTEYGQLITPMPLADPDFNLTLYEGLLVASQLRQWALHHIWLAEKYLLNSVPFLAGYRLSGQYDTLGLSVDSSMIAGPAPAFVPEPTGEVIQVLSRLGGSRMLPVRVEDDQSMPALHGPGAPVLQVLAGRSKALVQVLVINDSPSQAELAQVAFDGLAHGSGILYTLLDGPSSLAFNTPKEPDVVTITTRFARTRAGRSFWWTFPAHSLTLLQIGRGSAGRRPLLATGPGGSRWPDLAPGHERSRSRRQVVTAPPGGMPAARAR